jgi:tetratricopeptide (TPR) repeat protein
MRALVLLVTLVLPLPALADPTPDEVARAHYVSAQAYYKQGRVADALREFEEAYRIAPRPAFHYNIAICHEKLGNDAEAIAAYQRYLEESPDAPDHEAVQAHIDQLRVLHPPPPSNSAPPPNAPPPSNVPPEPAAATPSPAPAAEPLPPGAQPAVTHVAEKPSRAWVWGVAGGGIALVTVAVIIGVVVGTSGSGNIRTLPGVTLK